MMNRRSLLTGLGVCAAGASTRLAQAGRPGDCSNVIRVSDAVVEVSLPEETLERIEQSISAGHNSVSVFRPLGQASPSTILNVVMNNVPVGVVSATAWFTQNDGGQPPIANGVNNRNVFSTNSVQLFRALNGQDRLLRIRGLLSGATAPVDYAAQIIFGL